MEAENSRDLAKTQLIFNKEKHDEEIETLNMQLKNSNVGKLKELKDTYTVF